MPHQSPNYPLAITAMVSAAVLRLVPFKPPNFAAVGALSLYAGARLPWWIAPFVPLTVMFVTDAVLYQHFLMGPRNYYVYGCFVLTALVGGLLRNTKSPVKIGLAALATGLIFFAVTNFGVWLGSRGDGKLYADSFEGLLTCYMAALPFHRWTVVTDLLFSAAFFGAHAWLQQTAPATKQARAVQ